MLSSQVSNYRVSLTVLKILPLKYPVHSTHSVPRIAHMP